MAHEVRPADATSISDMGGGSGVPSGDLIDRIKIGPSRAFVVNRTVGISASYTVSAFTLGGLAYDLSYAYSDGNYYFEWYVWLETKCESLLQAGAAAVVFTSTESGGNKRWSSLCLQNIDQTDQLTHTTKKEAASATLTIDTVSEFAQYALVAYIRDNEAAGYVPTYENMDFDGGSLQDASAPAIATGIKSGIGGDDDETLTSTSSGLFLASALVFNQFQQKALPIRRPRERSIDAKTLADRFNRGMPVQPSYTWPGGRKFYNT